MEPRPDSPPPARWALAFVAVVVALQITVGLVAQMANLAAGLALTEALLFAAPAVLACRLAGYAPAGLLAVRWPGWGWVLLGLGLGLVNYPTAGALEALVRSLNPAWRDAYDSSQVLASATGLELGLLLVAVVLFAPVGEELVFRGFVQRVLRQTWPPALAIGVSAALFSGIHFDPIGFLARLELGVLFGLLAHWSGSLWPGVAAHAANNLTATSLYFAFQGREGADAEPARLQLLALLGLGALASAPLLALAHRRRQPTPPVPQRQPQSQLWGDVLAWAAAVAASLGVLLALDPRGVQLSRIDAVHSTARLRSSLQDPAARKRLDEHLRSLRARARAGELSLESYEAQRRALSELAGEEGPASLRALEEQLAPPAGHPDAG